MNDNQIEDTAKALQEFKRRWTAKDVIDRVGPHLHIRELEALRHLLYRLGAEEGVLDAWADAWGSGTDDDSVMTGTEAQSSAVISHVLAGQRRRNNRIDK